MKMTTEQALGLVAALDEHFEKTVLVCDGGCTATVTHIDDRGFIYCARHGENRQSHARCRKLRPAEIKLLKSGNPITKY